MRKLPLHSFSFKLWHGLPARDPRRGSALIGTLVMVGILALVVGVMLSSSSSSIRGSRDKILYEEAYQAALSGTHVARAWMIDGQLAATMSPAANIADLATLVNNAKLMNEKIISDKETMSAAEWEASLVGNAQETRFANEGITPGTPGTVLSDGRVVVFEFDNGDRPIVSFVNDDGSDHFTENLFTGAPANGHRNYVESVRITTPGTTAETSASLKQTTFIIESRGVADYAGTRKERVVLQRVLIYPNEPTDPLISAGEAILTKASYGIKNGANSHTNVHWAPVLAKGEIGLEFLSPIQKDTKGNKVIWELSTVNGNGKKYNGAGVTIEDPNFNIAVVDKWLKWMTGENGVLLGDTGDPLFSEVDVTVDDFFSQLIDGAFSEEGLTLDSLKLAGKFDDSGTILDPSDTDSDNGLYDEANEVGALVQGSPEVDQKVDEFFSEMNYDELKAYAKDHNGYYVYDDGELYDAAGNEAALPSMDIESDGAFDPLAENAVSDRMLFIDTANDDSADPGDLVQNLPYDGTIPIPDFWKGVMYINGGISKNGGSQDMVVRTPEQYVNYRADPDNYNESYTLDNVLMDGILICTGNCTLGGNAVIYGTLAAMGGVEVHGTPSVFYNSANGDGRLKDDSSQRAEFRLIAGKLAEVAP